MENNTLYDALVAACGESDNKYKTAELIRFACESEVNHYGYNPTLITAEANGSPEAASLFRRLCIRWIEFWGSSERNFDARNEAAVTRCKQVYRIPEFQAILDKEGAASKDSIEALFVNSTPRMHRTLMQSFTSVVTTALCAAYPELENARTFEHRLPLI